MNKPSLKIAGEEISFESLGIELIKGPDQQAHAGVFELPPNFPRNKYAVEWVQEDQVPFKEQRQPMPQVGAVAPGLTVYKGENGQAKLIKRHVSGNKVFVLMVRPKIVQIAMNALYGDVSKKRYNAEVQGVTVQGEALQDPGMLPASRLAETDPSIKADIKESLMELNKVPGLKDLDPESAGTVRT